MKLRYPIASLCLLAAARHPASAEPHKLIVMQSEGRADAAVRAKIDAAIVKLARSSEPQTTAGELTFTDAATAVGCRPEVPSCADEVLAMLAVDEIIITSVAPKPGGLQIVAQRVAKGGSTRDASMLLATGASIDKLDGIATLFGEPAAKPPVPAPTRSAAKPPAPARPPAPAKAPPPAPATEVTTPPGPTEQELFPYNAISQPEPAPSPVDTGAPAVEGPDLTRHRLELAGMGSGAGMLVLGVFFWGAARGTQTDVENAPTATREDLIHLRDLESKGDTYATAGNILALTGLVVGGVATYFYIRDHRFVRQSTPPVARLTPTVFDHGAGLVLTVGAIP